MLLAHRKLHETLCMASAALAFAAASALAAENRSYPEIALTERHLGPSGGVALNAGQSAGDAKRSPAIPIAAIDFDYQDTSGEPRNQTAEHRALMTEFMTKLRSDLAAEGKFAPVTIACADPPCTAANMPPAALIAAANKMLTFRGDTNEAWLRAEAFLANELRGLDVGK